MKNKFLMLFLYLLIGFILIGGESMTLFPSHQVTMVSGIVDGFFLPARIIAGLVVEQIPFFPRGFQTIYSELGMFLGVVLILGLIVKLLKK